MVVRWTAEKDQLLLLKMVELHPVSAADAKKIADSWPGDKDDKPTHRAISQHVDKLRAQLKAKGELSCAGNGTGTRSVPSTPRKPGKSTASTPNTGKSKTSPKKRKIQSDDSDDDEVKVSRREVSELTISPSRSGSRHNSVFQGGEDREPRQKRAASAKVALAIKKEAEVDSDDDPAQSVADSDISNYAAAIGGFANFKGAGAFGLVDEDEDEFGV
ncbi:hypothetical protein EJ08DRAFT_676493 [Tothia fuscella]|uniref:Uncharacterized protein n=1 Tax=Tothia fuscella TaxID=1048955 RepID=A0A9P4NXX6_9PEZI|nr:hypothetical protein EJ08DRAFT_676493 [Tothia fuscella]